MQQTAAETPEFPEFPSASKVFSADAALLEIDGVSKAAVVLLSLGPEMAAEVLRALSANEIKRIANRLMAIRRFSKDQWITVLRQFKEATSSQRLVAVDVEDFMLQVHQHQQDVEASEGWRVSALAQIDSTALSGVEALDADLIFERLKDEHPQMIAAILAVLKSELSAAVSRFFEDSIRNELLLRVALLERLQSVAWEVLNEQLRDLANDSPEKRTRMHGVKQSAALINALDEPMDDEVLDVIRQFEPELAQRVEQERFVFEDLMKLPPQSLQALLIASSASEIAMAMQSSSEALKRCLLTSVPKPLAEAIREFTDASPAAKPESVREAQQAIIARGRNLHRLVSHG